MPLVASDEQQLFGATLGGRDIFTRKIRYLIVLGKRYPHRGGIILALQKSMELNARIEALDRANSLAQ